MIRSLALFLTAVTGFSGLVYEVAWQRGLAILLGSHSEATAAVLAIFLGGLSLGYSLFGRLCQRTERVAARGGHPPRLLFLYGIVEAGIGLWALVFPGLFALARSASVALPIGSEALSFSFDVVLTALLIGPPTILMGGTIPILTQSLSRNLDDATRLHALVYGLNTAGAFAGALSSGYFMVPWLGIPGTLRAMGVVNLLVGAAFVASAGRGAEPAPAVAAVETTPVTGFRLYAAAALLLGFAMMAIQTVLIRVGGLALGASHFTFATVVAAYVLCIALGSLAVSLATRIPRALVVICPALLTLFLLLLYLPIPYAPYGAHVLRILFRSIEPAFYPYYLSVALAILVILALPLGLSGASLPLLFHALRRQMGELGNVAGRLYGWNTVGNLLGALLGGYVLLHWLDLHHVYRLGVAAAGGATLLLAYGSIRLPASLGAGLAVLLALVLVWLPAWDPAEMSSGHFRRRDPLPMSWKGPDALLASTATIAMPYSVDDPVATVAVKEHRTPDGRVTFAIVTNGKPDSSLAIDYPTTALSALLPCLYVESCENAFVVGLGTGVTAGELASLDDSKHVVVAEISQGVIDAMPFFAHGNRNAAERPQVKIIRADAYRALSRETHRFDVIASEPSNPWVVGVEMLFSREFLATARDRLAPGGVYAQWLQSYETNAETMALVLRTYASVFEEVAVWYTVGPDLLLLGFRDPASRPAVAQLRKRAARRDFRAGLRRAGIGSWEELVVHELVPPGIVTTDSLPAGEVHTLLHPLLSDRAAHAFFVGEIGRLPTFLSAEATAKARQSGLLSQWVEHGLPDAAWSRMAQELCATRPRPCATLLARWIHERPASPLREDLLARLRSSPVAAHLDAPRLALLTSFFGTGPPGSLNPRRLRLLDTLFREYHQSALPFRAASLLNAARRCPGKACASARRSIQSAVGSQRPAARAPAAKR